MAKVDLSAAELMRHVIVSVRIHGLHALGVRLFVAKALLRLSAFIAGCGIEIETEE